MEPHRHRRRSYKPIHAKERRNGPPSANQDPSTQKQPRYLSLALPPLVLLFLLAQSISLKVIARSNITNTANFN